MSFGAMLNNDLETPSTMRSGHDKGFQRSLPQKAAECRTVASNQLSLHNSTVDRISGEIQVDSYEEFVLEVLHI
jgi:hypothetical protein